MDKHRFETIIKICIRAEELGIGIGTRMTRVLDMENADNQFALRLDDMLEADDFNFVHDFIGIQKNMNRLTGVVENCFLPRFATK